MVACKYCGREYSEELAECPYCWPDAGWSWVCPQCYAQCSQEVCSACGCPAPSCEEDTDALPAQLAYPDFFPKEKRRLGGCAIMALTGMALFVISLLCFAVISASMSCGGSSSGANHPSGGYAGVEGNENIHENQVNTYYKAAAVGETLTFADYENSFTHGAVWCRYNLTLTRTARGEQAQSLVSGEIPPLGEGEELYLAMFTVEMLEQHTETPVKIPPSFFRAYASQSEVLPNVNVTITEQNFPELAAGQKSEGWVAFAVRPGTVPVIGYKNVTITSGAFFKEAE